MEKQIKITFCGGTGSVTGSNFLFEVEGKKFLVDCGLNQSSKLADDTNWEPFPYDPASIEALFVTHSHVDHIGRIPKLVHDGFKGKIYSTAPTKELTMPMLEDTIGILSHDKVNNLHEIYAEEVLNRAMSLWTGLSYHETVSFDGGVSMSFLDAGHILGSGMLQIIYNGKKIIFTGDLGNSPSPLLCDTEKITDTDYLIMESVYGDRNHEDRAQRKNLLEAAIRDNIKRKGVLVVPTFSLERSQELLFEIDTMIEGNLIPLVPVFFDSPLAIKLTAVYRKYPEYFNPAVQARIKSGDDIFLFPGLQSTPETQDSKMINRIPNPKVVIAGSGMSNGGRIIHHEHNYLPDPNNTLLLTGYQSLGTLGRLIQDGAKTVHIDGDEVPVRARVTTIDGYSGHKDSNALQAFVADTANTVKRVFAVMGEPKSSMFLVQRLRDYLGVDALAPELGDVVTLDCK